MRKIYITESQLKEVMKLKETINQTIDKKPGESIDTAVRRADMEVRSDAPNADVNFVIPKDEINEDGEASNIVDGVVDFIYDNWRDEIDETSTMSEIYNMVQDAYIEVAGSELTDKNVAREIVFKLHQKIYRGVSESYTVTKKAIKEAKRQKRLSEAVNIISKENLLKGLNK